MAKEENKKDPILIIGAGTVGLTLAAFLAKYKVPCILVEKRKEVYRAPRAHVVMPRSMEIFRELGIEHAIRELSPAPVKMRNLCFTTGLMGAEFYRYNLLDPEKIPPPYLPMTLSPSPTRGVNVAQYHIESMLRAQIENSEFVQTLYGDEWVSSEQNEGKVISQIKSAKTDNTATIDSSYLIACDGAGSRIRKSLNIPMEGNAASAHFISIHFIGNLKKYTNSRPGVLYWVFTKEVAGTFIGYDAEKEWVFMKIYYPSIESPKDYTEERCYEIINQAVGEKVAVEIKNISHWGMTTQVAKTFQKDRILLAGDAAHRFSPTGGLGQNTGVGDVHNLAWKLRAIYEGWAAEHILSTYEAERKPIAIANATLSYNNWINMNKAIGVELEQEKKLDRLLNSAIVQMMSKKMQKKLLNAILGKALQAFDFLSEDNPKANAKRKEVQRKLEAVSDEHFYALGADLCPEYKKGLVIPYKIRKIKVDNPIVDYVPSTNPGARLPHAWVFKNGVRTTTHDLVSKSAYTFIVGENSDGWIRAFEKVFPIANIPLTFVKIGKDSEVQDSKNEWAVVCGIESDGIILLRPDGHVAWRSTTDLPHQELVLTDIIEMLGMTQVDREKAIPRTVLHEARFIPTKFGEKNTEMLAQ